MTSAAKRLRVLLVCVAILAASTNAANACSVCFGDADSPMTKGAAAGVWALGGITGMILLGMAGMSLSWLQRSRRLAQSEAVQMGQART